MFYASKSYSVNYTLKTIGKPSIRFIKTCVFYFFAEAEHAYALLPFTVWSPLQLRLMV